ncbi:MAG: hypothetical protein MJ191_00050 [Clostridium sp.]|nr:hypothetical protein [Clostridium sp.]
MEDIDMTEELVEPVNQSCIRDLNEVAYEELTEEEKKGLIAALKLKCNSLDNIAQQAFENNKRIEETYKNKLRKIEDALTFIRTQSRQSTMTIDLVIRELEREVR